MIEKLFSPAKQSTRRLVSNLFTIPVILAMFFNLLSPVGTVLAEGSKDTVDNGGKRANTEWRTNTTAGYYRRTFFRVYANSGEYILMGSSAMGVGSGDIVLYRESQVANSQIAPATLATITPTFRCSTYRTTHAGAGTLDTRAKELAGPASNTGGYTPCVYQATETGTYWVGMYGPDGVNGNSDGQAGTVDAPVVDASQRSGVSMWDITVRSDSALTGTTKTGRVFVDYLAQFAGGNGDTNRMYSTLYAVTPDGYVYKVDLNGLDPAGYILYGNRVGFYDPDGKTPLYHDVVYTDNSLTTPIGGVVLAPASAKFFFQNPLTSDLPVSLLPTPVTPNIDNVNFVGTATSDTSYYSQGGVFTYTGNVGGISEIVIQGNTSTDFEPDNPLNRRILSESVVGSNSVTWDGKDNSGNYFPVRTNYPYKVVFHAGEYHFPLLDSENSVFGGPTLTLLNPIGGVCPFFSNCHGAFYDDRVYKVSSGAIVPSNSYTVGDTLPGDANATNPPSTNHSDQNSGFDTSTSQRGYGGTTNNGFGNWKALDLWTYYPVDAISKTLNVIATTANDLSIFKSHNGNFSVGNDAGTFSIVVKNVGTASIGNVNTTVSDTLPTGMTLYATPTGTNWNCTGAAGASNFSCSRASGASNRNLASGASFEPITVHVNVASSIAASVTNTATLTNTNDGNASNNSSSDTVSISRAELTVGKTDSTAQNGLVNVPFNWEITARNSGELAATFAANAVILSDPLSSNATYGTPTVITENVTNSAAISCAIATNTLTCKANGATVTMLEAGSSIKVTLPVTPTVSGSLANTATVDPNNVVVESNESNNTGGDTVTVGEPKLTVLKSSTSSTITAANQVVPYTFTLTNPGTQALSSISVSDAKCDAAPTLSSGDSNNDSKLDTSETWVYNCVHTVTQAEFDSGTALTNTVTADSAETSPVTSTLNIPVIHLVVTKDAAPSSVLETGGSVTYTFTVKNLSSVPMTISSLNDDKFGALSGDADCKVGTSLAIGATCDFTYTTTLSGAAATNHVNTFTVEGTDGAGNTATASDDASVTFTDVKPVISVTKTANPVSVPETGGDVLFTFTVNNSGTVPLTISSISDDVYGTLAGDADCKVGTSLLAGASCTFEMTQYLSGPANSTHRDVFSASANDSESNTTSATDDAVVTFTDVKPLVEVSKSASPESVNETGGNVTFTFTVTNTGTVPASISALTDSIYGTLAGDADCKVGTNLAAGASCSFDLTQAVSGAVTTPHVNVFSATIKDNEDNTASDTDDATVTFIDIKPSISVNKEASPTHVAETGANVTFTFTVTNTGTVPAAITSLSDDVYGTLSGDADCKVGISLAAGASCNFTQTELVSGAVGSSHKDTFTAGAADADGNTTSAQDDATVTFDDVLPAIEVSKTASLTEVDETGADVTFTFQVKNTGSVPVTLASLSDSVYGTLSGDSDCAVGTSLAANTSCDFTLVKFVSGSVSTPHNNVFTVNAQDAEGNAVSDFDDATITFTDVKPVVTVTKVAAPASVPETGGDVTFTFTVQNSGTVQATITELSDSVYGTLSGDADCKVGTRLAAGTSCDFTLVKNVSGAAASTHTNVFSASVADDDANTASDTDDAVVTFTDVLPSLEVTKTANPTSLPETGGNVTYTYTVHNTGTVSATISALSDDKFGTLSGDTDCQIGTVLSAGASCSFEVSKPLSGAALSSHTNVFSASAEDAEGNTASDTDDATVTFSDVLPALSVSKEVTPTDLPETGGNATYTFTVTNTGGVPVTLESLSDDVFGPLAGDDDCKVGTVLPASGSCSFTLVKSLSGEAGTSHTNTFTASGKDADGNSANDSDDATVSFTDVFPSVVVSKTAAPTSIAETGANVTFTFVVKNNGTVPATINALTDSVFGALSGDDDCKVGTSLAPNASCTFDLTRTISGVAGVDHVNTFSATVSDADGNDASDDADASVSFTEIRPAISVTKSANPTTVAETGGDVTFTITVSNTGPETVTIDTLNDDVFGALTGDDDCKVGTALAAGTSCDFTFTRTLSGTVSTPHINTVTAVAKDSRGYDASDTSSATVDFSDVPPAMNVTKAANPDSVPETGADVTFTYTVNNTGAVAITIDSMDDSVFGTLAGDEDCKVGTALAAGTSCSFETTEFLSGLVGTPHQNTFSVEAHDADGNAVTDDDSATVAFTDVLPDMTVSKTPDLSHVPETGGNVTFTFTINNVGDVPITIQTISDSVFGSLDGDDDCKVGTTLAAKASCEFTLVKTLSGSVATPHSNTLTVVANDSEGNPVTRTDTAAVSFDDVLPAISVNKTAAPTEVPETGGDVTFTFAVTNTGSVDVTLDELTDNVFGSLVGDSDCQTGTVLAPAASCSFTQTEHLSGAVSTPHTDVFTASAHDGDDNPASANDDATVTFADELPAVEVSKDVSPDNVAETGGNVVYTFTVHNTGPVTAEITSLQDNVFGALVGDDDCKVGSQLSAGASCSFTLNKTLSGAVETPHENVFTADVKDTEGNTASANDDAVVTFNDVLPSVSVNKEVSPDNVNETGGDVTFTFTVTNDGTVPATITSLEDDVYGTLSGDSDCQIGSVLAPSASCSFTLAKTLSGLVSTPHTDLFTAEVVDHDGNPASASDDATVNFNDVLPEISVQKIADPVSVPETGGDVTFTFTVENTGLVPVTINTLSDSVFGVLSGDDDCKVGTVLNSEASCSFTQVESLSGVVGVDHTNTFSATASDVDGNTASDSAEAVVSFTDVLPSVAVTKEANPTEVPETGGDVTFTFTVTNDGTVPTTITSLEDSVFGTLTGDADCQPGTVLAPSASCSFSQIETISGIVGTPHTNTFTAKVADTEGNEASKSADASVDFSDVVPTLSVEKTATPGSVDETGADVTFTFTVHNTGTVPVTITTLNDSVFGTLAGDADCQVGTELAGGSSCSFEHTEFITGTVGEDHVNTFSAVAEDSEGNEASDNASATVTFNDVLPAISVEKSADKASVDETGADVLFTFTVNNIGTVPVTVVSLTDDVFGTLSGDADCQVGTVISAGGSCSFTQTEFLSGSPSTSHHNTFTATATDADKNSASANDDATVTFNDVLPSISVNKVADPTHLPESGGSVTYTYTISNNGPVAVMLTSLADDRFSISGDDDCKVGTSLNAGSSCSFTYTTTLSGATGSSHVNTVSVTADDAEGNPTGASDDASVTFDDVLPAVEVTKDANPTMIVFTGADVTFTFTVKNTSTVPEKITSLVDDVFGPLSGDDDCKVDTELAAGASCSFTQVENLSGEEGTNHVNTFTATVSDTDGNSASDSDDATVTFDGTTILGIAKELVSKTQVETGNYDLTFRLLVKNYGTKELSKLQVEDDLSSTFPSPTIFTITSVTSDVFTVDPAYDGTTAHKDLLVGTDVLKAGESGTILITLNVTPSGSGPFNNTALTSAETPTGDKITDQSQDGPDPDGPAEGQDGNPNNNSDPTPVKFEGQLYNLPIGVKSVDATNKPTLTWTVVWINNTNKVPVVAEMHDAIPSKTTFVEDAALTGVGLPVSAPAGSTITGVSCDSGTSTTTETTACYYEAPTSDYPLGQIVWSGKLGPDLGITDPALAVNAIRITYSVTVNNTSYVKNTATLDADLNGDGNTNGAGETKVAKVSATWGKPPATQSSASAAAPLFIPQTGFAPGVVTPLAVQPASSLYADMDAMTLEIPALNINTSIVGVPQVDGEWDVSWLGNDAGWLNGTAFPTWAGNSVITGHVFDANGKSGLFADLTKLKYGDQIILHAFGQSYYYEVRETKLVTPNNISSMTQHEDAPWLTLVTCRGYDEANNNYYFRYLVRAVQVKIK